MTSHTQDPKSQFIALSKLKKSPRNVRLIPHTKAHIESLADSIEAHGQLHNLVVETEHDEKGRATGFYLVTAGEGRRLAHLLRVKRKQIKPTEPVRCIVDDTHNADALSLAENIHEQMHPADEFEAFKRLIDGGQSIEEVAGQFGVTPRVVERRLKLANVAPEFLALYRKDAIKLDHLMALAITDDHDKQRKAWESLPKYDRHPDSLRRVLTESEISLREPIVKFVGLKTYEKAGGLIRRDMFAEQEDDGYVMDAELLRRLATEKLEKAAAQLKEAGYPWVEIIPELDYATLSTFGHVQSVFREPNAKEQKKLDALKAKQAELDREIEAAGEDEDKQEELSAQADAIEAEIHVLMERLKVADPQQQAVAGAIVSIGHGGDLDIKEGLLKPEDAKRFKREKKADTKAASPTGPRIHSAGLTRRLTAHRTLALQATLAQRPDVALIALTHRLVLQTFFKEGFWGENVVQIDTDEPTFDPYAPDVKDCKAQGALAEQAAALRESLPDDPATLFAWLLQRPQDEVLKLCAYCVATTINGVTDDEGSHALDALANAAGLDMNRWWVPTADNYLNSLPKARILDAVREAVSPEIAATLTSLKKGALAQAAEKRLAGTGWLPKPLRGLVA